MTNKGKAEYVIEDVAGCGPFQVVVLIAYYVMGTFAIAYSILFMAFGNYNPGWRCMDNVTRTDINTSTEDPDPLAIDYTAGSCDEYTQCNLVEFNPDTSTLRTEWGLLCDKEWISSTIISIQMLGMLIGSVVGGQLSDLFGRKKIYYCACAVCAVLELLASFSVSWVMFIVIRFFLGVFDSFVLVIMYINLTENMTLKWRTVAMAIPFWYAGTTVQALVAMGFKDWRNVERVGSAIFVLLFLPVFWVPENLRWLEVKGKTKEFRKVAKKIVRCNGHDRSSLEQFETMECSKENLDVKRYTVFDLWRSGYKFRTFSIAVLNCVYSMIYYAISFGINALYGDFYINLILSNVISIPLLLLTMPGMRLTKRTTLTLIFLSISVVCLFGALGCLLSDSEDAKATGGTVLILFAKSTLDCGWIVLFARITEMYPTVIRTTALGFASLSARVGGILAPFVIPSDKSNLYIFIIISAVVILASFHMNYKLPETKTTVLKETFNGESENEMESRENGLAKDEES